MKSKILALMVGLLFVSVNVFAADGDLIINGKVGIGTASPTTLLEVKGSPASNWITTIDNSGTSGHKIYFGYNNNTDTTYGLYITGGRGVANQLDFAVQNKFYVNELKLTVQQLEKKLK